MSAEMIPFEFEGMPLPVIAFKGKPFWPARQTGATLGYGKGGGNFSEKITSDWSEEFIEGTDFLRVEGEDLDSLRRACGQNTDAVALAGDSPSTYISANAPSLLLLTESGVWIASLLSRKPAGRRLRRFLATEVLPRLARGQSLAPAGSDSDRIARLEEGLAELLRRTEPRALRETPSSLRLLPESTTDRVAETIRAAGENGITRWQVLRQLRSVHAEELDLALQQLGLALIVARRRSPNGRPATVYRLH